MVESWQLQYHPQLLLHYDSDKGKLVARRGRKATDLFVWRWPGCRCVPNLAPLSRLDWKGRRSVLLRRTDGSGTPASPPNIYLVLGADTAGVGRVAGQFLSATCAEKPALRLSACLIPLYYPLVGVHGIGLAAARDGRG